MNLTKAEEEVMMHLWELGSCYMKDLVDQFPEPRPAYTTIATLISRMVEKGAVAFNQRGKVREYYPVISKEKYFEQQLDGMIGAFFNGNPMQFASFFASNTQLTQHQWEELKLLIEKNISKGGDNE